MSGRTVGWIVRSVAREEDDAHVWFRIDEARERRAFPQCEWELCRVVAEGEEGTP